MNILVKLIKFVVLTIITICIIILGIVQISKMTVLDKSYIVKKLEETNFYDDIYELVKSNFENYIYQSGLDESVLNDICTKEKVKNDVNLILSNIYDGTSQKIETEEIKNNLNNNIDKLNIKNMQNENSIEQFVDKICSEYEETLNHTKYEESINKILVKLTTTVIGKITNIISLALIILVILIIIINNKNFFKNLQDIGIVLLASSVFEILINIFINTKVNIQGIKVFNEVFSKSLVSIIQDIFNKFNVFGIILLVISIVIIVIYSIIISYTQKKEKE